MRTVSRLAVASAILGGGLMIAAPASAQVAGECDYPFDCEFDGGGGGPATGGSTPVAQGGGALGGGALGGGALGGGGTMVEASTAGGGGALPFTGGEVTLMALAGTAALGGGIVLVAAGRKRATV